MDDGEGFQFRLLGPFELVAGGEVIEIGSPKQRLLLAMLVLRANRAVSVDELTEALWDGQPPASVTSTLPSLVSRLRAVLATVDDGVVLRAADAGYVIELNPRQVDAYRFEELAAAGHRSLDCNDPGSAIASFSAALALWRGVGLAGLEDRCFARAEATRLQEARLRVVERLADAELAAGRPAEALDRLEHHLSMHPLREKAWACRMLALYRLDRQAEALSAYQEIRRLLVSELGVEPGPALRRLEARILRQSPELDAPGITRPVPHNLPTPLSAFLGRARELDELAELLAQTRLLTLAGVGGVGKTRLALELAARVRPRHRDGVWLIELAGIRDPSQIASETLSALGIQAGGLGVAPATPAERLCQYFFSREVLLVLDNCEHLVDAVAELVGLILARCSRVVVLATSRESLGLPGEAHWLVPGLSLPPPGAERSDDLAGFDAVALFRTRAVDAHRGFGLTEHNASAVVEICRRLDGIPLAIELAAARMRVLSPHQVAEGLNDRFRLLAGHTRGASTRHHTLRAAMDWSYELLAPEERALLGRLCVFPQSFDLEAARAVAAQETPQPFDVLDVLSRLVDKSLVTVQQAGPRTRYRMLETIRQYAAEKLTETGSVDEAHQAHRDCYLVRAEKAVSISIDWFAGAQILDSHADHDNLLAALDRSMGKADRQAASTLAAALWPYWIWSGRLPAVRELVERLRPEPRMTGSEPVQDVLFGLAAVEWGCADSPPLKTLAEEFHKLALSMDDPDAIAFTHYLRGCLPSISGEELDEGSHQLSCALEIYRARDNPLGMSWCHYELGSARFGADLADARSHLEHATVLEARIGTDGAVVRPHVRAMLGVLTALSGDEVRAHALADEAVQNARRLPLPGVLVMALVRAGQTATFANRHEQARTYLVEALTLLRDIGAQRWVAESLEATALILAAEHRLPGAAHLLGAADRLRHDLGERLGARSALAERVNSCRERIAQGLGAEGLAREEQKGREGPVSSWLGVAIGLLTAPATNDRYGVPVRTVP
jgi:predicted ATPase/DNA-binding SARP family transcriptional activator